MTDDATLTEENIDTTDTVAPDVAFDLTDGEDGDDVEIDRPCSKDASKSCSKDQKQAAPAK
jgi:hypothetical protein